jgi:predicted porin
MGVPDPTELPAFTSMWNYTGRSDVLNLGTTYVCSPQTTLTGGFEFVRSWNYFGTPPSPATAVPDYSDLPGYSQVRVNTYRIQAGVDYMLSSNLNTYFRYNYYDFDDMAQAYNAGTAHMLMGGFSGVY